MSKAERATGLGEEFFAVSAPGLEAVVAAELKGLGVNGEVVPGGVVWRGGIAGMRRVNLNVRTAARVLMRVCEFRARTFFELERHAARVPWSRFVGPGAPVQLRVTSRKSRLYHEGAIAERLARAVAESAGARVVERVTEEEGDAAQLFVVRVNRDDFTVSADTSGALLHRRGYRQEVARAPLRENLAAALLEAAGWRGAAPLLDPFCGSGTIPIEAALMARRIPPGLANPEHRSRRYAFERWPEHDEAGWQREVEEARSGIREAAAVAIVGSDRSAAAVRAARGNAERAGVAGDIDFEVVAMSRAPVPAERGVLVTNPPYGVRVTVDEAMRRLYAEFGGLVRARMSGWRVVMLSPDAKLERETRLGFRVIAETRNGGIPVRLVEAGPQRGRENDGGPGRYD